MHPDLCPSALRCGIVALTLAVLLPGSAAGPAQAQPEPGVSGGSKAIGPSDNCFGDNTERYNLSSRCDPAEHQAALVSLDALRGYYALLGGDTGEEVQMIDQLRPTG